MNKSFCFGNINLMSIDLLSVSMIGTVRVEEQNTRTYITLNNNMMYKTVYTMLVLTGGEVLPFTVSLRYKLDILPIDGFQLSIKHPTSRDKRSIKRLLYSRPFTLREAASFIFLC